MATDLERMRDEAEAAMLASWRKHQEAKGLYDYVMRSERRSTGPSTTMLAILVGELRREVLAAVERYDDLALAARDELAARQLDGAR